MAAAKIVDVVVPTVDARDLVLACARHLREPVVASVVIVDDASGDGTADAVRADSSLRLVRLEEHVGLAFAFNRGAEVGTAPYVLFLNNDIFAAPGAVDRLVEALEAAPGAGSAAGRLVDPGSDVTQLSYQPRALPGAAALFVRLTGVERAWPANPWTGQHLRDPLPQDATVTTHRQPAGACLLVRRADHQALGGWDERFWIWYEDVDYSRRLLERRGPAVYEPRAVFEHVGGASTGGWGKPEQHRRLYHGTLQYAELHLSRPQRSAVGLLTGAVAALRLLGHRADPAARRIYRDLGRSALRLAAGRALLPPARD